jgi:hypothetical protein
VTDYGSSRLVSPRRTDKFIAVSVTPMAIAVSVTPMAIPEIQIKKPIPLTTRILLVPVADLRISVRRREPRR